MEPTEYYERVGLYLPEVIFPTGLILQGDELRLVLRLLRHLRRAWLRPRLGKVMDRLCT